MPNCVGLVSVSLHAVSPFQWPHSL